MREFNSPSVRNHHHSFPAENHSQSFVSLLGKTQNYEIINLKKIPKAM